MADHLTVLTTIDAAEKAQALAASAVKARLVACAQIDGPITSVYRREGAVQTGQEWHVPYRSSAGRCPFAHVVGRPARDRGRLPGRNGERLALGPEEESARSGSADGRPGGRPTARRGCGFADEQVRCRLHEFVRHLGVHVRTGQCCGEPSPWPGGDPSDP
ncbi:divalent cation tolerance protein CutA [Streptomyces cucumeris]|uniref:divalent cation tolerance protein CutA n=1 Tax=Streptomyces cucumeris TaxID=2962890 RepID=UPI003D7603AD